MTFSSQVIYWLISMLPLSNHCSHFLAINMLSNIILKISTSTEQKRFFTISFMAGWEQWCLQEFHSLPRITGMKREWAGVCKFPARLARSSRLINFFDGMRGGHRCSCPRTYLNFPPLKSTVDTVTGVDTVEKEEEEQQSVHTNSNKGTRQTRTDDYK